MECIGVISRIGETTKWCAGMVVVAKKLGNSRICINLTQLNKSACKEKSCHQLCKLSVYWPSQKRSVNSMIWGSDKSPKRRNCFNLGMRKTLRLYHWIFSAWNRLQTINDYWATWEFKLWISYLQGYKVSGWDRCDIHAQYIMFQERVSLLLTHCQGHQLKTILEADSELMESTNIDVDYLIENLPANVHYLEKLCQHQWEDNVCSTVMQVLWWMAWTQCMCSSIKLYWAECAYLPVNGGLWLKAVIPYS